MCPTDQGTQNIVADKGIAHATRPRMNSHARPTNAINGAWTSLRAATFIPASALHQRGKPRGEPGHGSLTGASIFGRCSTLLPTTVSPRSATNNTSHGYG